MLNKIKIIFVLILGIAVLSLASNSYSRYISNSTGNLSLNIAKWQILIDNVDITSKGASSIAFTPTILENENIAPGVVAPSSKGYFDISIDPSNVDLSFSYNIDFEILNKDIPDLIISKYAILPYKFEGVVEEKDIISLVNNNISNTLTFDKQIPDFKFEPFTIRLFFEWYEGNELDVASDEDDAIIGNDAAVNNTKLQIEAKIKFEQYMK